MLQSSSYLAAIQLTRTSGSVLHGHTHGQAQVLVATAHDSYIIPEKSIIRPSLQVYERTTRVRRMPTDYCQVYKSKLSQKPEGPRPLTIQGSPAWKNGLLHFGAKLHAVIVTAVLQSISLGVKAATTRYCTSKFTFARLFGLEWPQGLTVILLLASTE
jgi:hypothetical protein